MAARQKPNKNMECNELQQEIMKLQDLLKMENANYAKVFQELQDTKKQLAKMEPKLQAEKDKNLALWYELKLSQVRSAADLQFEKQTTMALEEELNLSLEKFSAEHQEKQAQERLKLRQEKMIAELKKIRDVFHQKTLEEVKLFQERELKKAQLTAQPSPNLELSTELKVEEEQEILRRTVKLPSGPDRQGNSGGTTK
ncbi:uncharacterized protein AKAME5_000614900 [Lates japonicus]|uniref:Uncharacterized protein n=1 Tax=Lates japonicus TaxID=270547 RepID=A0AAD3MH49_LATJO|nr:uncharacterized protein AKAME5_000614900 [Lates japonicus]